MRAKAQWQAQGEKKSTRYFCNLEKKHYLEKFIPKLIGENNIEITDAVQIRQEQKQFYEKIYKSSKPILDDSHRSLFLNDANPFITKLSNEEVSKCKGDLTFHECLS